MSNNSTTKAILSSAFVDSKDDEIVMVSITAQDIGYMTSRKFTPYEFNQELLSRLRVAGAPIEGSTGFMKATRGKIMRMKTHPLGPLYFGYLWFSDEAYARLTGYREAQGFDTMSGEAKLVVN